MNPKTVQISGTPHVRKKRTVKWIMLDVLIALIPTTAMGIFFFGGKAAVTIVLSLFGAVATEFIWLLCKKMSFKDILKQFDFSSPVTGLLLALTLPPLEYKYFYIPLLASVFAVGVVKMLFGGTGKNIVNPAIAGRVFAFISFQSVMVSGWAKPLLGSLSGLDATSSATPLTAMFDAEANGTFLQKLASSGVNNLDLFLGTGVMGCIGETCKVALLAGFIYLVVRRVIKWQWPVIYVAVTGLLSCALAKDMGVFLPSILSGGLLLGAIFMATDYVTSPNNKWACYVYYVVLGAVTALLRFGTRIEVVSFAIMLMNLTVPLFNMLIRPRPFGSMPIKDVIKNKFAEIKAKLGKKDKTEVVEK